MKKTRKLIPALAMLLISAVMLSTASFAWFATNKEVSANNMTVTANANTKYLQISTNASTGFGTAVDALNTNKSIDLINAKLADNKTVSWYLGSSTNSGSVGTTGEALGTDVVASDVDPANPADSKYALINTFYFKMSDTSNAELTNLDVKSITVSGDSSLQNALRVLVVGYAGSEVVGAQIWKTDTSTPTKMVEADANNADYLVTSNITKASPATVSVKVYVYYDGEDDSATSDNATDLTGMTVSVLFEAGDVAAS